MRCAIAGSPTVMLECVGWGIGGDGSWLIYLFGVAEVRARTMLPAGWGALALGCGTDVGDGRDGIGSGVAASAQGGAWGWVVGPGLVEAWDGVRWWTAIFGLVMVVISPGVAGLASLDR